MNAVTKLGQIALGSRLKLISDLLYSEVDSVYKAKGFNFQARWFVLTNLLYKNDFMGVTELANELGQTHSAVSQISKKLLDLDLVLSKTDPTDERRRLLSLSKFGKKQYKELVPIFQEIEKTINQYIQDSGEDLHIALNAFQAELNNRPFAEEVLRRLQIHSDDTIKVLSYDEFYKDDFKRLNIEWLERFFYVEKSDDILLSNPEESIITKNGQIFFAEYDNLIVGTAALSQISSDVWKCSNLAVTENYQGLHIGQKLAERIVSEFNAIGSGKLVVETNSRLIPAIKLYDKLGFKEKINPNISSSYQRTNTYMVYTSK